MEIGDGRNYEIQKIYRPLTDEELVLTHCSRYVQELPMSMTHTAANNLVVDGRGHRSLASIGPDKPWYI